MRHNNLTKVYLCYKELLESENCKWRKHRMMNGEHNAITDAFEFAGEK